MSFSRHRKSIHPMCGRKPGAGSVAHSRRSSVRMSLRPAIPWRVGLHQSPPPLHRPGSECVTVVLPVENFAANGKQGLNRLCQPRGQPQSNVFKPLAQIRPGTLVPIHWNSAHLAQNIFRAMRDRQCSWASGGTSEKGQTFRCYACLVPAMPG